MNAHSPLPTLLRIGDWDVDTATGLMVRGEQQVRLEDRLLRLLMCLAREPGAVLSMDDLLAQVWPDVIVTPDSVYQAITTLRRQLGDDPKKPAYIANVPRKGYRLIAAVGQPTLPAPEPAPEPRRRARWPWAGAALLAAAAVIVAVTAMWPAAPRTVAVLPFSDLTDAMSEEPFADGMTEEIVKRLSKVPGIGVAPPAAAGARPVVAYVLDGSVRKSGNRLRVTARLTRASDGLVAWSESYERSWDDKLMIQDDIAAEVSKALDRSIQ